nr:uncharacterized protein K02A2.6-like [Parasteatoda tepidariorum]
MFCHLHHWKRYILQGWPKTVTEEIRPFWLCRAELSVEDGLIFRGGRIFVPQKFRRYVLSEIHGSHQGICAVKALAARQSVWWPNMDEDIQELVKSCLLCQVEAAVPPSTVAPWPFTNDPWSRIHIDHAGPFENRLILLVVDAATKWLEAIPVASTSSTATIVALRSIFARFGLPRTMVSDNGTSFTSDEFSGFLGKNGITHVRTAPYHPQSNGIAERAVRSMKDAMRKNKSGSFQERLDKFLFYYRLTPNSVTGVAPSVAMFNRPMRSRLDLLKPESDSRVDYDPKFRSQDRVWCRNYGRGPKWIPGEVTSPKGRVMSEVSLSDGKVIRHNDQLRLRNVDCSYSPMASDSISEPSESAALPLQVPNVTPRPDSTVIQEEPPGLVPSPLPLRRSMRPRKPPEKLDL